MSLFNFGNGDFQHRTFYEFEKFMRSKGEKIKKVLYSGDSPKRLLILVEQSWEFLDRENRDHRARAVAVMILSTYTTTRFTEDFDLPYLNFRKAFIDNMDACINHTLRKIAPRGKLNA